MDTLLNSIADQFRQIVREELECYHLGRPATITVKEGGIKILTLDEFCEYTHLSKQTAYKLTSAQKVPHSKRGKRLYFDREKVDAWLLENQVSTQAEIKGKAATYLSNKGLRQRA